MKITEAITGRKKIREIFSEEVKVSGFNTAKPYQNLIKNMFAVFGRNREQAFTKTMELVMDYLSFLEESDSAVIKNNEYIDFKIDLKKADLLPLFRNYTVDKVNIHYADYQALRLRVKEIGAVCLNLVDQMVLFPGVDGIKTVFTLEKKFIETFYNLIPAPEERKEVEQDDLVDYVSIYNNLVSYVAGLRANTSFPDGILLQLNKLTAMNVELNDLLTDKFDFAYKAEVLNISYKSNTAGVSISQYA